MFTSHLLTVTYGTAPGPFIAVRVLLQLATDDRAQFRTRAEVIRRHSFMDDIFAGADNFKQVAKLVWEVTKIFTAGQFPLGKWTPTSPKIYPGKDPDIVSLDEAEGALTLGLI